jgi:hypothetical protein
VVASLQGIFGIPSVSDSVEVCNSHRPTKVAGDASPGL